MRGDRVRNSSYGSWTNEGKSQLGRNEVQKEIESSEEVVSRTAGQGTMGEEAWWTAQLKDGA